MHMQGTKESVGYPLLMLSALFPHDSFSRGAWSSFLLGCQASTLSGPAYHCFPMGEFIGPQGSASLWCEFWGFTLRSLCFLSSALSHRASLQSCFHLWVPVMKHMQQNTASLHGAEHAVCGRSWWSSARSARPVLSVSSTQCTADLEHVERVEHAVRGRFRLLFPILTPIFARATASCILSGSYKHAIYYFYSCCFP